MPHFMVIFSDGKDAPTVRFFDKPDEVDSAISDATCGVNLRAQCYEWDREDEEYKIWFE